MNLRKIMKNRLGWKLKVMAFLSESQEKGQRLKVAGIF